MDRFDFASVMAVIRRNIRKERCPNQMDLICTLFQDADIDVVPASGFHNGQVYGFWEGKRNLNSVIRCSRNIVL